MKFAVATILIVAAFAQDAKKDKKENVKERKPLIDASTADTVNDCLFIDRTNQGAIRS